MRRREVLKSCLLAGASLGRVGFAEVGASAGEDVGVGEDRAAWVAMLDRVAGPVLGALSERRLKASMPVEAFAGREQDRRKCTYLEALGRTLAGIAPWLENGARSGDEGKLRERYCEMARQAIAAGVDKGSPDYLDFGGDRQTIVDAAFLALAVVRAPRELREKLPMEVRKQLAAGLRATRGLLAGFNNWLLFAAMIEACLFTLGEDWDRMRVDYALTGAPELVSGRWDLRGWAALSLGLLQLVCHSAVFAELDGWGGGAGACLGSDEGGYRCPGEKICGSTGEDDCTGWHLPGGGTVDCLPVRGVSAAGRDGAAREAA